MKTILLAAALLIAVPASTQQAHTETLHVTSVEHKTEGKNYGSIVHIIAAADSKTIQYRIHCDEVYRTNGKNMLCFQIEAGHDYETKIWPTSIYFGEVPKQEFQMQYVIDSEVEK
jgi:hypothetical protein